MGRISKERMEKAMEQLKAISKEDHAKMKAMAGIVKSPRSFIFKTPDDYDLKGLRDLAIPSDLRHSKSRQQQRGEQWHQTDNP